MSHRTLPSTLHSVITPCAPEGRHPRLRFFAMGEDNSGGGGGGAGGAGGDGGHDAGSDNGGDGGDGGDVFKSEHSKNAVLADLTSERKGRAAAEKERDALAQKLAEIEDKNKTDEQRKQEAEAKRDAEHRAAQLKADQYEAAEKAGLPLSWAKRIAGATPEEMLADAQQLKSDMDAQSAAGHRTDGAGVGGAGANDTAATAAPGVARASVYYQTSK
ncbi:hypothetical protein [Gordonia sihwensis]|uniref:hypothetical protein n=1 Tax=Gordonia sihwensis TaxID=173559 RepID=UPI002416570D|nr:hypothetical protein [Gordonia sihwensis]WFN93466.1 hypothetical protein P5P27_02510 [Gordonia sihwensis]